MAMKYRIEYGDYPQYQRKSVFGKLYIGLLTGLLCSVVLVLLFYPPAVTFMQEMLIPGDVNVTSDALQQFAGALDTGVSFTDAMDVFCDAIMEVR